MSGSTMPKVLAQVPTMEHGSETGARAFKRIAGKW